MNAPLSATEMQVRTTRLVGEPGAWLFVIGDMLLFGLFFVVYAYHYVHAIEAFQASAGRLSLTLGLVNTLLLLTGSWFVASAVHIAREGGAGAHRCVQAAVFCGVGFVVVKAVEWGERFVVGDTPMSDDFFMFYFMLTGIHLMHVLAGLGLLCFLLKVSRRSSLDANGIRIMEIGGIVWHLVDLLWIVLFSLFYLFGAP